MRTDRMLTRKVLFLTNSFCVPHRANVIARRDLTAHQVAVALRPFYKMVHPDRFGQEPVARANNEKALQVFNGYLNECFTSTVSFSLQPVSLTFAIRRPNEDALENVRIQLSGADPAQIVRMALEQCRLSTENLPKSPTRSLKSFETDRPPASTSASATWSDADDLWRRLHDADLRRRKRSEPHRPSPNDLSEWSARHRTDALNRLENFNRTRDQLEDQVHEIVRKTGLKEIKWAINWDQSYMRRCLSSIDDMISQAEPALQNTITSSLMGRSLILGRGSYVCCDSSLQFGADDATGAWQKVCMEANVRTFELHNLKLITQRVRELFGGAELIVHPHASLLATTDHMKTLIVRVSLRPLAARRRIAEYGVDTVLEVMNAYCELAVLNDGRLQIPCNVDGDALEAFLAANASRSRDLRRKSVRQEASFELFFEAIIADLRRRCCYELRLRSLTWDAGLANENLISALQRLAAAADSPVGDSVRDLALHISHSPDVHLLPTGTLAIPTDWV